MEPNDRFHQLLKSDFLPHLRADGFKGSGTTLRRTLPNRIDIVNVQAWRSGGQCCVNLGTHFIFLPSAGGSQITNWKTLKHYQCVFRDRLHEAGETDHWWKYGASEWQSKSSVANLIDTYQRRGALFFERFEPFPQAFERVSPAGIDAGDLSTMPPGIFSQPLAALIMARIMNHLGRREKCREFAEVGLRHIGRAVALNPELERLRDTG
jgi:hypothetical protein